VSLDLIMTANDIKRFVESRALIRSLFAGSVVSALLLSFPKVFYLPSIQAKSPKASQGSVPSNAKKQASSSSSGPKKKRAKKQVAKKRVPRGQREIESSRVVEIQNALAATGFYKEQPSGTWDPSTSQAMSAYQESNGFKVTGKPDALSLKKLGL
jgi:hypothetical protein